MPQRRTPLGTPSWSLDEMHWLNWVGSYDISIHNHSSHGYKFTHQICHYV